MGISRSSTVASSTVGYASSLRSQRLRDSYQFNVSQLDALPQINAVSAIRSSLLATPSESINTAYFSARYTASADVHLSSAGKVQSTLSDLKTKLAAWVNPEVSAPIHSASSDEKIATGLANDSQQLPAAQQVVVSQLAQRQVVESTGFASSGTEVGLGSLTIRFGRINSATGEFSADGRMAIVSVDTDDASVAGIASVINKANLDLKAEVVTEASGSRLRFSSAQTGAGEAFTIDVRVNDVSSTENNDLSRLAYDPAAGVGSRLGMRLIQSAQDALLTINGRPVVSASTTVQDDTSHTSLVLQAVGYAEVTYVRDKAILSASVKQLAEAVNMARGRLLDLNDGLAQQEVQRLQDSVNAMESGSGSNRLTLADLGVSMASNEQMMLNEAKLAAALEKNSEGVVGVLADVSSRLVQTVQSSLDENSRLNTTPNSLRSLFPAGPVYVQQNHSFSLLQGMPGDTIPAAVQDEVRRYLSIAQL